MGVVVLHEVVGDAVGRELGALVDFPEKAARVLEGFALDQDEVGNLQAFEAEGHRLTP